MESRLFVSGASSLRLKAVLLVDSGDKHRITTKWFLTSFGFAVEAARNAEEALSRFDPRIHDVVITGSELTGMTGAELAHVIKLRSPRTPVILCCKLPPEDRSCLNCVIEEPAHLLSIKDAVDQVLAARRRTRARPP